MKGGLPVPTLYVVATPIGNLSDMTPRAVETLRRCAFVAAEDTRVTQKLLTHFEIGTRLISNHQHNEQQRAGELVARMLEEGCDAAVVTDAGTPCISDPGYVFVREAAAAGIPVLAVPGPTAMACALSVSGFDVREFAFYGFLPRPARELREKLVSIARGGVPIAVVHESPHRVKDLLGAVCEALPGCCVCACCDLTKLHEKTVRGTAPEVLSALEQNPKAEKGEYCLVLDLHGVVLPAPPAETSASLEAQLFERLLAGEDFKDAGAALQAQGAKRNDVYRAAMRVKEFLAEYGAER